jgi:hypothetical protein
MTSDNTKRPNLYLVSMSRVIALGFSCIPLRESSAMLEKLPRQASGR